ncbi:MAG: Rrf2 family transcriptional regulator [Trueperaceae bacterium]
MPDAHIRTLLTREESYAVHALIYAAEHPGASAARMARDLAFPAAFFAKVLARLVDAGLLSSRTGRSGGVTIADRALSMSLLDVIEAVSGPMVVDTCQAQTLCATQRRTGTCALNGAYHRAAAEIRRVLSGVRIGELADVPRA